MVRDVDTDPLIFSIRPEELATQTLRLDLHYYHPKYAKTTTLIEKAARLYSVKQLDEIAEVTRMLGFEEDSFVKYIKHGVPFLQVQNIKEFSIDLTNVKHISFEAHQKLKRSQLQPNDIVVTITGRVGTITLVPPQIGACNLSKENARIRVKDPTVKADYVAVYLNSRIGASLIEKLYSGSTRSRTLIKNLRKIPIIVPPKETQAKTVEKIMMLKKRKKQIRSDAESLRNDADRLLHDAYSSVYDVLGIKLKCQDAQQVFPLTVDRLQDRLDVGFYSVENKYSLQVLQIDFPVRRMDEIVDFSDETIIPQKEPLRKFRYVQIHDIDPESGRIISFTELLGKEAPSRARRLIHKGEILIAMSGSATGTPQQSTVIVTDAFDGCVATTGFGVLRAKQGVDPAFLYFMLRSSYILDEIARWLTGATIPSISASSFKKIQIPVPPIQVQKRIVSILRKASEESEKLTTEERNLIKKAEELDQEAENEFWHCLLMENESHSKIS